MKVKQTQHIKSELASLQNLINRLYVDEPKPSLNNLEDASSIVLVKDEKELLGFVALYKTVKGFLTLGNYQCVNNVQVAELLFNKVKAISQAKACQKLLGPINGNTWHNYRFSTKNVAPFFLEHHHKKYYVQQWQAAGFKTYAKYFTFQETLKAYKPNPQNFNWLNDKPNLKLRQFNIHDAENDLTLLHQFCCEAFAENLLYTPISESKFKALYQPILPYLKNDLIDLVIERKNNKESIVGFLFAFQDLYNPTQIIAKTIARKSGDSYKGMAHFLTERLHLKASNKGCEKLLHAYLEGSNKSVKLSQQFGGEIFQQHELLYLNL